MMRVVTILSTSMILISNNLATAQTNFAYELEERGVVGAVIATPNSGNGLDPINTFIPTNLDGPIFDFAQTKAVLGDSLIIVEQPNYAVIFGQSGEAVIVIPDGLSIVGFRWCELTGTCTIAQENIDQ